MSPILLKMQRQRNFYHVDDLAFLPILHARAMIVCVVIGVGNAIPRIDFFAIFAREFCHRAVVTEMHARSDTHAGNEEIGVADVSRKRRQHILRTSLHLVEQIAHTSAKAKLEVGAFAQRVNFGFAPNGVNVGFIVEIERINIECQRRERVGLFGFYLNAIGRHIGSDGFGKWVDGKRIGNYRCAIGRFRAKDIIGLVLRSHSRSAQGSDEY